jgi:hypothetical protein
MCSGSLSVAAFVRARAPQQELHGQRPANMFSLRLLPGKLVLMTGHAYGNHTLHHGPAGSALPSGVPNVLHARHAQTQGRVQACMLTCGGLPAGYCVVLQSRFEDPADAQGIIARGPEALQSQFASGFGMVLNLLHTRSLEEARAFVQRSFNNYLGVHSPPTIAFATLCSYRRQ